MKNNLESDRVGKLLFKLSLPSMIGLLVNSFYSIIDGVFIGKYVGINGLASITIAFPIQMTLFSFSLLFGTGASSLLSIAYGKKDNLQKNRILTSSFYGSIFVFLLLILFTYLNIDWILSLFGATQSTFGMAKTFLFIVIPFAIFQGEGIICENYLRSYGNTLIPMTGMIFAALLNIVLDYIFIANLHWGIVGAGFATGIAQLSAFLIDFMYIKLIKKDLLPRLKRKYFSLKVFKEVTVNGIPAFSNQMVFSFRAIFLNNIVFALGGDISLAVLGIVNRLGNFIIVPVFGVVHGMRPIVGFAYGSGNYERIKKTLITSLCVGLIYLFLTWSILQGFPSQIMSLFTGDPKVINYGISVLRVTNLLVFLAVFDIVIGMFFQSLKKIWLSLVFSTLWQFIIFAPLVIIAWQGGFGIWGVWFSFPLTDIILSTATIIAVICAMRSLKSELQPIKKLES